MKNYYLMEKKLKKEKNFFFHTKLVWWYKKNRRSQSIKSTHNTNNDDVMWNAEHLLQSIWYHSFFFYRHCPIDRFGLEVLWCEIELGSKKKTKTKFIKSNLTKKKENKIKRYSFPKKKKKKCYPLFAHKNLL